MNLSGFDREHIGELIFGQGWSFNAELLRLIAHADSENLERIRLGFPEVVAAYEEWSAGP